MPSFPDWTLMQFVLKLGEAPKRWFHPQVIFDYRCYLPNGKDEMGTDYPPKVWIIGVGLGMRAGDDLQVWLWCERTCQGL